MPETSLTIADSIAIKILNKNGILIGVGNELHLHKDKKSDILPFELRGKVHGIEHKAGTFSDQLLIHGEKEFMLIKCTKRLQFDFQYQAQLTDLISTTKILENVDEFVILTAHSVLLRFAILKPTSGANINCKLLGKYSCADKSTLYCSHIYGTIWNELVIFGGNAFGELLIWQPTHLEGAGDLKTVKKNSAPLQRLPMHNGVIFSINYHNASNLLTTTSDDRSIKFCRLDIENNDWSKVNLTHLASGYGHVARVFQGKIIDYKNNQYAITVGEDSNFCVWSSEGTLLAKRRHQFGATIWNFDYDSVTQTMYTVGSTGNLLAYNIQAFLEKSVNHLHIMPPVSTNQLDYISKVKFIDQDLLIGFSSKNRLLYKYLHNEESIMGHWQLAFEFESFRCTVMEVCENYIALCGYKRLMLFKYDRKIAEIIRLYDEELLNSVIRGFHFLSTTTFIVSDDHGACQFIKDEKMTLRYDIELPKCKERWLTAALSVGVNDHYLLLCNRQGYVLLYELIESLSSRYELKHIIKQPHGNLGVTGFKLLSCSATEALVRSFGHDGALKLLRIDMLTSTLHELTREIVPVAWVERLLHFVVDGAQTTDEVLFGFNDNHFVAWSKFHDFMVHIPCGGGHRNWHYSLVGNADSNEDKKNLTLQLAFIKHKQVRLYSLNLFNTIKSKVKLPPCNMWHTKCCNALVVLRNSLNLNETILISGGDDNLVKVSTFLRKSRCLKQRAEIHTHISNIRAICVRQLDDFHCLIFSGGGRAQLCVTRCNLRDYRYEEIVSYTLISTPHTRMQRQFQNNAIYTFDPETRIMAIDVLHSMDSNDFYIYCGCSDGFLRKLRMNHSFQIEQQEEIFYGKCVLQVRLIANQFVLTGATDGIFKFYNLELDKTLLSSLIHHASGINAVDVLYEDKEAATTSWETRYTKEPDLEEELLQLQQGDNWMTKTKVKSVSRLLHVLSGGDDQTVTYSILNLHTAGDTKEPTITVLRTLHLNQQHTAQVTAVLLRRSTLYGDNGEKAVYAFTSGVDQNIIKYNLYTNTIEQIFHTCVADMKGICLAKNSQLCFIYGCGLQIYDFAT